MRVKLQEVFSEKKSGNVYFFEESVLEAFLDNNNNYYM